MLHNNIVIGKEKYIYILQVVRRDILRLGYCCFGVKKYEHFMASLSIQINHHAGTPKHNNCKRHDKGYSSICYIGSKIGWTSMKEVYKLLATSYRYRGDIGN